MDAEQGHPDDDEAFAAGGREASMTFASPVQGTLRPVHGAVGLSVGSRAPPAPSSWMVIYVDEVEENGAAQWWPHSKATPAMAHPASAATVVGRSPSVDTNSDRRMVAITDQILCFIRARLCAR